jgi:hypothetical protein
MVGRYEINLPHKRIQWHSSQISVETGLNDRGQRARTEEKQRKKDEKLALRKAERDAAEAPPDHKQN